MLVPCKRAVAPAAIDLSREGPRRAWFLVVVFARSRDGTVDLPRRETHDLQAVLQDGKQASGRGAVENRPAPDTGSVTPEGGLAVRRGVEQDELPCVGQTGDLQPRRRRNEHAAEGEA